MVEKQQIGRKGPAAEVRSALLLRRKGKFDCGEREPGKEEKNIWGKKNLKSYIYI